MLKELIKIANHLDQKGLRKEADHLDFIIRKMAMGDEIKTEVTIEDWEAPGWGKEAADKLEEALRENAPDLDLISAMESSIDEEALDRYEEEVYLTRFWTDDLLKSFNKGFEYTWELTERGVDYKKRESVYFALSPKNPWAFDSPRMIAVRYTPGKLKIRAYEN